MEEDDYTRTRSEFIRRVRFQVELSKALDRAIAHPSCDPEKQEAIVGNLIYCLNELDVAFANPHAPFPEFSEDAHAAAQRHDLLNPRER